MFRVFVLGFLGLHDDRSWCGFFLFHWAGTCALSIGKLYFIIYLIISIFLSIVTWAGVLFFLISDNVFLALSPTFSSM